MNELLLNPVLVLPFSVWLVTQTLKWVLAKRHNPDAKFSDSGGMPSAHAAVIGSAATAIAWRDGLDSSLFGLAAVVTAIVMHDAFRLRWAVGEQASRINAIIDQAKLKNVPSAVVWRGHRLREVVAGFLLGIGLTILGYLVVYQ